MLQFRYICQSGMSLCLILGVATIEIEWTIFFANRIRLGFASLDELFDLFLFVGCWASAQCINNHLYVQFIFIVQGATCFQVTLSEFLRRKKIKKTKSLNVIPNTRNLFMLVETVMNECITFISGELSLVSPAFTFCRFSGLTPESWVHFLTMPSSFAFTSGVTA